MIITFDIIVSSGCVLLAILLFLIYHVILFVGANSRFKHTPIVVLVILILVIAAGVSLTFYTLGAS